METDIYRSVKVLDTFIQPEVVAGLFDIGDGLLQGEDADSGAGALLLKPPNSVSPLPLFPSILTNHSSPKHVQLEKVYVMLNPPDILYRGVRMAVKWIGTAEGEVAAGPQRTEFMSSITLSEYYESLGQDAKPVASSSAASEEQGMIGLMPLGLSRIETEGEHCNGKAVLGGTVTLANGWAFKNPNGGALGLVVETLFESSARMDRETCDAVWLENGAEEPNESRSNVHGLSPEQVMNDKEPFKVRVIE